MGRGVVGARPTWIQRRASCHLSEPQLPHWYSGDNVSPFPNELVGGLNKQILVKVSQQPALLA